MPRRCPLCNHATTLFRRDTRREYHQCPQCALLHVPPEFFLSLEDERIRYDQHDNNSDDPGYRQHLSALVIPLTCILKPGSRGLDFGSGPGPTLHQMLEEFGHHVDLYDPFYAPQPHVWNATYDFIVASETIEHLRDPQWELTRLWAHVAPGGHLGLMTQFLVEPQDFDHWYYKNDLTHIVFYSPRTFTWLAQIWQAELCLHGDRVAIFHKPDQAQNDLEAGSVHTDVTA